MRGTVTATLCAHPLTATEKIHALGVAGRRRRALGAATSVAGVLLLLGACAGSGHGSTPSPAAPARSDAPASACAAPTHTVCLTPSSGGKTVTLTVGWTLDVDLHAPNSVWSGLSQVGADLLQRTPAAANEDGAISASYRAVKPGQTTLRAFERPRCAPTRACPQFILLWQAHIRVRSR
jgi:hypothetical protein